MQSQQLPPDFHIGYGTEVEESGDWFGFIGLAALALVVAVAVYLARKRKGKMG